MRCEGEREALGNAIDRGVECCRRVTDLWRRDERKENLNLNSTFIKPDYTECHARDWLSVIATMHRVGDEEVQNARLVPKYIPRKIGRIFAF